MYVYEHNIVGVYAKSKDGETIDDLFDIKEWREANDLVVEKQ